MQKTPNQLNVFESVDSSLSFKQWRDLMAAKTQDTTTEDDSNMEKIDKLFTDFVATLKASDGEVRAYAEMLINQFKKDSSDIINKDENGNITIGGGLENGAGIIFNDGVGSSLINGILTVLGVEASDYLRLTNYVIKEVNVGGTPHLRVSYSPKTKEVVE